MNPPMVLCVVSPDMVSMSMFLDFYRQRIIPGLPSVIHDMDCLLSRDRQSELFSIAYGNAGKHESILVRYRIRKNTQLQLPDELEHACHYIIKFDIFSSHPEVIKDSGDLDEVLKAWEVWVGELDGKGPAPAAAR